MRNGKYILIKAPDDWPGRRYRGNYCYEHQYVYWKHTGINPQGLVVHHKDENKHNNEFCNLEITTRTEHATRHMTTGRTMVDLKCPMCGILFTKPKNNTHLVYTNRSATYCSKKCGGRAANVKVSVSGNVIRVYNSLTE